MGLIPVAPGELAAVVTTLEMRKRPAEIVIPPSLLRLEPWDRPAPDRYRTLFAKVGAPWLWFSRLAMSQEQLTRIIHDPAVEVSVVVDASGTEVGLLELDFRQTGAAELGYLALVPERTGQGHGRWLMAEALVRAWRPGTERVWVHTCTLDHPAALGFYQASGFTVVRRTIETFADPRLSGLLPMGTAPRVPPLAAGKPPIG